MGRLDPTMQDQLNKIIEATRKVFFANGDVESRERAIIEENLQKVLGDALQKLGQEEFNGVIMIIRGQVLKKRLTMHDLSNLNQALWKMSQESQDEAAAYLLRRLASCLKSGACATFRGILSGGEISCRKNREEPKQHFILVPFSYRMRRKHEIGFSISRRNTQKCLEAHNDLIQEAKEEKNQNMVSFWEGQKEIFLYLIKAFAPRLLEEPTKTLRI